MLGICAARGIMGYKHVTPAGSGHFESTLKGSHVYNFMPPGAKIVNRHVTPPGSGYFESTLKGSHVY